MSYVLKKMDTWRSMKKKLAMPKILEGRDKIMEHPYSLGLHSIHHISTHMHFSIMVVWLAYSLGPIFDFAKYLRQVCLSFSHYLELHQKAFRSRRKKAYKRPWWAYKHFWANESVIWGNCFYFQKLLKTSGRNLEQGMGKWCFMNRSISQLPKTRRRPKAPWRLR